MIYYDAISILTLSSGCLTFVINLITIIGRLYKRPRDYKHEVFSGNTDHGNIIDKDDEIFGRLNDESVF